MAGVVFAKLTRSKARANTLLFTRKAVVCLRDNKLVLMLKVADLRKSLIVGANVKARVRLQTRMCFTERQYRQMEIISFISAKVVKFRDEVHVGIRALHWVTAGMVKEVTYSYRPRGMEFLTTLTKLFHWFHFHVNNC